MDNMPHLTQEAIVLALDGEISAAERMDIDTHLANCPECLSRYEELAELSESLHRAIERTSIEAQTFSRQQLQAALDASSPAVSSKRIRVWGWGAIAAALVLLAFFVRSRQEASTPEPAAPRQTASATPRAARIEPGATGGQSLPAKSHVRQARRRFTSQPRESGAGFVRLPYSNPSLPLDSADVIRVQLRLSALADAGVVRTLPGTGDPLVQADVLLGLDGQPSAIRILQSGRPH